jgi:hypothetical protein
MSQEKQIPSEQREKVEKKYAPEDFTKALEVPGLIYKELDSKGKKEFLIASCIIVMRGILQDKMPYEEVEKYIETFIETLGKNLISDFSQLQTFTLDGKGILEVVFVDGKKRTLDLKPEGKVLISQIAMERMRATSAREVFKEEINSESYLWGNIIAVFETVAKSSIAPLALWYAAALSAGTLYHTAQGIRRTTNVIDAIRNPQTSYTRVSYKEEAQALIKKIWYKTPDWKLESVDVSDISKEPATRWEHSKRIIKLLAQKWIVMSDGWRFDKLPRVMTRKFLYAIDAITDPQQIGRNTPEELTKWKEAIKKEVTDFSLKHDRLNFRDFMKDFDVYFKNAFNSVGKLWKLWFKVMEKSVFWAVFFREYGKNMQDAGMLAASLWEVWLFTAGASVGGILPWMLRLPGALVWWWLAVAGGHYFAWEIWLDKEYWKIHPEREDAEYKLTGQDGNNGFGTILSMNAVHEILDRWSFDVRFSPKWGIDINAASYNGIDFRGSANPQKWMTQRRGVRIGDNPSWYNPLTWLKEGKTIWQDVTIPEADLLSTSINFKTNPREWMGITQGRDVTLWNKRVEEYRAWLTNFINKLTDDYRNETGIFRPDNVKKVEISEERRRSYLQPHELDNNVTRIDQNKGTKPLRSVIWDALVLQDEHGKWYEPLTQSAIKELQKQELLKKRMQNALWINDLTTLKTALWIQGEWENSDIIDNIVWEVTVLARDSNKSGRKKATAFLVWNYTEYLTITPDFLLKEKIKLVNQETVLKWEMERFAREISDPKLKSYFLSLLKRFLNKEWLVWARWTDGVYKTSESESKLFDALISSTQKIKDPDLVVEYQMKAMFSGKWKKWLDTTATISDVFYDLLNKMLVYKRQKEFVENIEKYGKWHKWHWEWIEKIIS